jgi:hypothetical protein
VVRLDPILGVVVENTVNPLAKFQHDWCVVVVSQLIHLSHFVGGWALSISIPSDLVQHNDSFRPTAVNYNVVAASPGSTHKIGGLFRYLLRLKSLS